MAKSKRDLVAEARARLASDHEPLKPDDFDVSVGNVGKRDANASREKRQEFSRAMGELADATARAVARTASGKGSLLDNMPGEVGSYVAKLAEQERRFNNRRVARSVSLFAAHEALAIAQFKIAAKEHFSGKITPRAYALKKPNADIKRSAVLLLSDLHLGSELDSLDEPIPFRAVQESRRLEYVVRQLLDFKPQYRNNTEAVLLINGDIIEGQLGHELRGGAPLAEQKFIAWRLLGPTVALVAAAFPSVRIVWQPGNHGRDKVRHPGRATARKWDGHEFEIGFALREMCSRLQNVTWQLDFRAVSKVNLHGSILGLTHGDTEVRIGHPDTAAAKNFAELAKINASRIHGCEFQAWAFGHFHTPRYHPGAVRTIYNGALVPPNGYARTAGYIAETCGQFIWEAVEGYPVGDVRFIEVGHRQDADESLGKLIPPWRISCNGNG